jgi:uncharacterized membrane protein YtjA (UPF0391 family)
VVGTFRDRGAFIPWQTYLGEIMLRLAFLFLILGLIAGVLGFTGIAGASFAIAKFLFFIFLLIFVVLLIAGLTLARRLGA